MKQGAPKLFLGKEMREMPANTTKAKCHRASQKRGIQIPKNG